ncbi:uncharacterized protein EDB93DRAFT_1101873 [Suillus bovinus]|uniref:uncharacterized protein n=1 Tax=Suillus bovinus TaxID=48563 RepID=UPI001B874835|nr:uncharacterized protein EDB93DRAFT_1101873 [Suillus bovinus]KAG2155307.1 hypothetical protein EDB93DRAFT_1101873 [Suillus bovinus]
MYSRMLSFFKRWIGAGNERLFYTTKETAARQADPALKAKTKSAKEHEAKKDHVEAGNWYNEADTEEQKKDTQEYDDAEPERHTQYIESVESVVEIISKNHQKSELIAQKNKTLHMSTQAAEVNKVACGKYKGKGKQKATSPPKPTSHSKLKPTLVFKPRPTPIMRSNQPQAGPAPKVNNKPAQVAPACKATPVQASAPKGKVSDLFNILHMVEEFWYKKFLSYAVV